MKKKILIGSILIFCIMMLLPSTSVAESGSAEERLELKEVFQTQTEENLIIKNNPYGPTCILRILLIIRNLILLGFIGIIGLLITIKNMFSNNSSAFII